MLVQIDEDSATLTPFGSLASHIHPVAPTVETKSWSGLLRSCFLRRYKNARTRIPPSRMFVSPRGDEMPDTQHSILCPRCQSRMAWYSADCSDDPRILHNSYQCEKCGLVRRSDDQAVQPSAPAHDDLRQ